MVRSQPALLGFSAQTPRVADCRKNRMHGSAKSSARRMRRLFELLFIFSENDARQLSRTISARRARARKFKNNRRYARADYRRFQKTRSLHSALRRFRPRRVLSNHRRFARYHLKNRLYRERCRCQTTEPNRGRLSLKRVFVNLKHILKTMRHRQKPAREQGRILDVNHLRPCSRAGFCRCVAFG